jgi:hypothetical protein
MLPCRSWLSQPINPEPDPKLGVERMKKEINASTSRAESLSRLAEKLKFKISVRKTENLILVNEVKAGLERISSLEREIARLTADNRALRDLIGL